MARRRSFVSTRTQMAKHATHICLRKGGFQQKPLLSCTQCYRPPKTRPGNDRIGASQMQVAPAHHVGPAYHLASLVGAGSTDAHADSVSLVHRYHHQSISDRSLFTRTDRSHVCGVGSLGCASKASFLDSSGASSPVVAWPWPGDICGSNGPERATAHAVLATSINQDRLFGRLLDNRAINSISSLGTCGREQI